MTRETGSIWKSVAVGAVAGLAGAWAMNQFQALLSSLSEPAQKSPSQAPQEEDDATVRMAQAISQIVFQHDLTRSEKKWAGPAVHYGIGASFGALYSALAETMPVTGSGFGTAYGTLVWAVGDELAIPAFGFSPPIPETPASSHVNAFASHAVYGVVLYAAQRGLLALS